MDSLPGRGEGRTRTAILVGHKLVGLSQPVTILSTGLEHYVVKFLEFSGPCGLMSEVIGTELMAHLGLPVSKWAPIHFSESFIQDHPEIWWRRFRTDPGKPPCAGVHFGSRLIESRNGSPTLQRLPSKWIPEVRNRADFVGALLVDLWTNNCDRRQCIFSKLKDGSLRAVFIDHGHMFGNDLGGDRTCARMSLCRDPRVYEGVWTNQNINRWKKSIEAVKETALDEIVARVPRQWASTKDLAAAKAELMSRQFRLNGWIEEITTVLGEGRFVEFEDGMEAMASAASANDLASLD